MINFELTKTIEQFANATYQITDAKLENAWAWQSYDSEGVRFAFFRTYEELRELATKLRSERISQAKSLSAAQLILAQYDAAYWDLQAALLGVGSEQTTQVPAAGEWPIRNALAHIIMAEIGFYVVVRYTLGRYRSGDKQPVGITKEIWMATSGMDETSFGALMEGPAEDLRDYHGTLHERVLREFADISDTELDMPSKYWEKELMSIRFRLHRFDSHLRQHTIQIDKTRAVIGLLPNEAQRLVRLVYSALADVNGAMIGEWNIGENSRLELAEMISERTEEIARKSA